MTRKSLRRRLIRWLAALTAGTFGAGPAMAANENTVDLWQDFAATTTTVPHHAAKTNSNNTFHHDGLTTVGYDAHKAPSAPLPPAFLSGSATLIGGALLQRLRRRRLI